MQASEEPAHTRTKADVLHIQAQGVWTMTLKSSSAPAVRSVRALLLLRELGLAANLRTS